MKDKSTPETSGAPTSSVGRVADIVAKVLCVILAFVLWLYVMQTDSPEYESTVSGVGVELTNTDFIEKNYDLYVFNGFGNLVDVNVIGQRSIVNKLTPNDIRAYVDLSSITKAGQYSLEIITETPNGIKLGGTSYGSITVYVDEKDVKTVDVKADIISISLSSQCEIGALEIDHDAITVTGPKAALENISHAYVGLSLGSVSESTTAIGQLKLIDKSDNDVNNPYIKMSRKEVTVSVPIYSYKTVDIAYSLRYGYLNPSNSQITLSPSSVRLKGDPRALESIDKITLKMIDERQLTTDAVTITMPLDLPDGVTAADGTDSVVINVRLIGLVTREYTITKVSVVGDEVPYTIENQKISFTIRAPKAFIEKLDEEKMYVRLNLSGYSPESTYTIELEGDVVFPEQTGNVYILTPPKVKVQFN